MRRITWLVEPQAFSDAYRLFCETIERRGDLLLRWNDDWWETGEFPRLGDEPVVFHGSLGNAHRIAAELPWRPGAFCAAHAFRCSAWYAGAKQWLVHDDWSFTTVQERVADPSGVAAHLANDGRVFVRPDSALKPFSGRVCGLSGLTLKALDFGFYYDDPSTPVVVAPVRVLSREWRFVIVDRRVVASCAYEAASRSASNDRSDAPVAVAREIAQALEPPDSVYVLDLCETDAGIRLLELNPFSGADLYACDPESILREVGRAAQDVFEPPTAGS